MDAAKELLDVKAEMKLAERKLQAVINLLAREGLLSEADIEAEFDLLVKGERDEGS